MNPRDHVLRLAFEPVDARAEESRRDSDPVGPAPSRVPSPERLSVLGLDRRTLTLVGLVIAVGWLVFVFGRAVADSEAVSQREAGLRAGNAVVERQLQARTSELAVVQSDAFVTLQARAFGVGTPQEQVFALRPGLSPAPQLPVLGEAPAPASATGPLDAWLNLLFGP
jgi:hypothetical protein